MSEKGFLRTVGTILDIASTDTTLSFNAQLGPVSVYRNVTVGPILSRGDAALIYKTAEAAAPAIVRADKAARIYRAGISPEWNIEYVAANFDRARREPDFTNPLTKSDGTEAAAWEKMTIYYNTGKFRFPKSEDPEQYVNRTWGIMQAMQRYNLLGLEPESAKRGYKNEQ